MNCKKCGAKVSKNDAFCTHCGEKIVQEEVKTSTVKAEKVETEVVKEGKKESNGLAIAGMVLGICGLVLSFIFGPFAFLLPLLGLIFSIVAKGKKGFKITGIITSIVAIIIEIIVLIFSILILGSVFSILGGTIGTSLKAYEPYGEWKCTPYPESTYESDSETTLKLNTDGTYIYGPTSTLSSDHYSGTFTFETEDDKNTEYVSQGYKFIMIKGEVDEFKQNGKTQSTYGKSLNMEMELFKQYGYDKSLIIFTNSYNMYMCER